MAPRSANAIVVAVMASLTTLVLGICTWGALNWSLAERGLVEQIPGIRM